MASITGDLNSLQQVVGGYIEAVYPYDDPVAIVCHEEGKLIGLPLNRKLEDYDIMPEPLSSVGLAKRISIPSPQSWQKSIERNLQILRSS